MKIGIKKWMAYLLVLCMLAAAAPAMADANRSALVGKWTSVNAQEIAYFPIFQYNNTEKRAYLYLMEDGVSLGSFVEDDNTKHLVISTWSYDGKTFTADTGIDWIEIGYDAKTHTISLNANGYTLYYEKSDMPVIPGNPVEIADIHDLYGTWRFCGYDSDGFEDYQGILGPEFLKKDRAFDFLDDKVYGIVQSKTGAKNTYSAQYTDLQLEDGALYMTLYYNEALNEREVVRAFDNGLIGIKEVSSNLYHYYRRTDEKGFGGFAFDSALDSGKNDAASKAEEHQADAQAPTAAPEAPAARQIRILDGKNPNVRSKPNTDGQKLGNAKSGQVFELLDEKDGWYKIRLVNGIEGWISGKMAEIIN